MSCKLGLVERASHSCWAVCIQSPHAQAMAEPVSVATRSPGMLVVSAFYVESFLALTLRRQRQRRGSRCWQPAWPAPLPGSRSSRKALRRSRRSGSSAWRRCTAAVVVWWTTALWLRAVACTHSTTSTSRSAAGTGVSCWCRAVAPSFTANMSTAFPPTTCFGLWAAAQQEYALACPQAAAAQQQTARSAALQAQQQQADDQQQQQQQRWQQLQQLQQVNVS